MKTTSQRAFEAALRRSRGLAHPAAPAEGGGGWRTRCERDGCNVTFESPTRQRRYCSTKCRRMVEEHRAGRRAQLAAMLVLVCEGPGCMNVFLPHPRNPSQVYCSPKCRKRGNRAATDLSTLRCANPACGKGLPADKTRRRMYCGPTCRKTAWVAAHSNTRHSHHNEGAPIMSPRPNDAEDPTC